MSSALITKINLAFEVIMILVYLSAGCVFLFFNFILLNGIDVNIKRTIGGLIISYAFYRLYRTVKKFKSKEDENETNE